MQKLELEYLYKVVNQKIVICDNKIIWIHQCKKETTKLWEKE